MDNDKPAFSLPDVSPGKKRRKAPPIYRCKVCRMLGDDTGYCKNHRPDGRKFRHVSPFRDNFINDDRRGFKSMEERTEFPIMKDFGMKGRW